MFPFKSDYGTKSMHLLLQFSVVRTFVLHRPSIRCVSLVAESAS